MSDDDKSQYSPNKEKKRSEKVDLGKNKSTKIKTKYNKKSHTDDYRLTLFKRNSMKGSGNIIGEGTYGMVFEASAESKSKDGKETDKKSECTFAIKRNYVGRSTSLLCCVNELDLFVRLNKSPFIVNLRGVTMGSPVKNIKDSSTLNKKRYRTDKIHLIFEKGEYDGRSLIYSNNPVSYAYIKLIMCHILLGIEYMHSKNIIHRDLKPDNIIWFRYGNHRAAKICDFGMSQFHTSQIPNEIGIVTPWYRAPELLFGSQYYTAKIDIWSAGCIFYELVSKSAFMEGDVPKEDKNNENSDENHNSLLRKRVLRRVPEKINISMIKKLNPNSKNISHIKYNTINKNKISLKDRINLSKKNVKKFNSDKYGKYDDFLDVLGGCMKISPLERMTATDALNHDFFDCFRNYIDSERRKSPPVCDINDNLNPKLMKYYIVSTVEREWAMEIAHNFYYKHKKDKITEYFNFRMLFQAISLFDRYLHYLNTNNYYNHTDRFPDGWEKRLSNNDIKKKKSEYGPFMSRYKAEIKFMSCLYFSIKYFATFFSVHSLESYVKSFLGAGYDMDEVLDISEKHEILLINTICNYHIYNPTIFECADIYGVKMNEGQVTELFIYFTNMHNPDELTLLELFNYFICVELVDQTGFEHIMQHNDLIVDTNNNEHKNNRKDNNYDNSYNKMSPIDKLYIPAYNSENINKKIHQSHIGINTHQNVNLHLNSMEKIHQLINKKFDINVQERKV